MISSNIVIYNVLFLFCLASQINSIYDGPPLHESLPPMTFRCKNGQYVVRDSFCEMHDEPLGLLPFARPYYRNKFVCEDNTHRSFGCDPEVCGPRRFKCTNGSCMDINVRCNTKEECTDGSDELNCGDEVNIQNSSLSDGKFLCKDSLRVLDLEYLCNKECNCFDCSDENANCTMKDDEVMKECPHTYFETPNGPKCLCDPNDPKTKNLCEEIKPCSPNKAHLCDQKCTQYKSKIWCSCYENYFSKYTSSRLQCLYEAYYDNLLAYSTSNQMKLINLTSGQTTVIKKNIQFGDLTGAKDYLYYTTYDDDRKTLNKVSISTGITTKVAESNLPIVSIAIDYVTNNLYYTTNTSLLVCSEDGRCLLLKCCNVRYVALAPKFGLMFYMKKGEFQEDRFIMKSAMDGSNEEYLVDGGFRYFSPLAIDESTRKIYWAQFEENEIWSVSFGDAYNKKLSNIKHRGTLLHFTVLDSALMFTKIRDNEIYSINNIERYSMTNIMKTSEVEDFNNFRIPEGVFGPIFLHSTYGYKSDIELPIETIALSDKNATRLIDSNVTFSIKYLHAFNPTWQNSIKNPCSKTSCDGLCLLLPGSSYVCKDYDKSNSPTEGKVQLDDGFQENNHTVAVNSISTHASESYLRKEPSENHWALVTTGMAVMALMVFALGVYVGFNKRFLLRNMRSNQGHNNDRENIFNNVAL